MKYVPVLRYRQEERRALSLVKLTPKIMPLIEIVSEKTNIRNKEGFGPLYTKELKNVGVPLMVDFPMYLSLSRSTKPATFSFLSPIQTNINLRIEYFKKLRFVPDITPVVTYIPQKHYKGSAREIKHPIILEANELRKIGFTRLAFRLYIRGLNGALQDVSSVIKKGDILLLDLEKQLHQKLEHQHLYPQVISLGKAHDCVVVIIRSAINDDITNVGLIDGQPVGNIDNTLINKYKTLGFDAFGDYAGLKRDRLYKGGPGGTPGFLFYFRTKNEYIGFKGHDTVLQEYSQHILPSVFHSSYFNKSSDTHLSTCPGCSTIIDLYNKSGKCDSHAKWKGLAVMHYLHTMEECL